LNSALLGKIVTEDKLIIHQLKEWAEIFVDIETVNRYETLDAESTRIGTIIEKGGGVFTWLKRLVLRSHRALEIGVYDNAGNPLLEFNRKFFWFFSDIHIIDNTGQKLGSVHRRFGIINKRYDLYDSRGQFFASIKSPFWRLWTFPILDKMGANVGVITKRWQGVLAEVFTDADSYMINFSSHDWSDDEKVVALAAAISVDFDFFEDNQGKSGGLLGI